MELAFTHDVLPQRVVFAAGSFGRLPEEIDRLGLERVLVVAGGSASPLGDDLEHRLGDRAVARLREVRQHVPEELAEQARHAAKELAADVVVTIGGGSATGLGKAVAVTTGIPVVAVPTTYAGSEMTPVYGITGTHKQTGRDLRVLPRVVLYDPALTISLPARATGATGFNAIAHCVEALYAPGADPLNELYAREGLRRLAHALPLATGQPADIAVRGDALWGACLAGMALAGAGVALHHRLCHVLGGSFGVRHGEANAVLLPYVAAFNAAAAPDALGLVADELEATDAASGLRALAAQLALPASLAEIGMPGSGLDEAAELAVAAAGTTNPRPVDVPSLRRLLEDAYRGVPPKSP